MSKRILLGIAILAVAASSAPWLPAQPGGSLKESPAPGKEESVQLGSIGSLSASHLYQTYLNIGMVADARAEGVYDDESASEILGTVLGLADAVDKQLALVAGGSIPRDDKQALAAVAKQSALLRQTGAALQAFWKSGKKADGDKYEKFRKESWAGLQRLLGLDE